MIKELCFWCGNPFPCGTPHPEGSDELARVLMDLEATTQCPDVDNNLQRAKIIGTLLQAERAATLQPIYDLADKWADPEFWKDTGNMMDSSECAGELLNISEATAAEASALSAVVQRETAKLRELLRRCLHADDLKLSLEARIEHGLVSQLEKDIMAALK